MTYPQALAYLDSLANFEKRSDFDYKTSFKLERMQTLSQAFGNPQEGIKAIHIGGTKGKGSVSAFLHSILMEAGYKTGLYTSPHLFSPRERIRINGEAISKEDMARLIEEIKLHVDTMPACDRPTYFEICTLAAFLHFKRNAVDFMVLEVGMGGRLDSTNIAVSLISVITPVSYDHTGILGATLAEIAGEKCGIIKRGSIVISAAQRKEAMGVIEKISADRGASLYVAGRDIFFEIFDADLEGQSFRLLTGWAEHPHLRIGLLGSFQVENAAIAAAAAGALGLRGVSIGSDSIRNGLLKTRWPGRFQLIDKNPFIVVDGAQNAASAAALKEALQSTFSYHRLFLVIGAMKDKDLDGICGKLAALADFTVATQAKSERACPPKVIRDKITRGKSGARVTTAPTVQKALEGCRKRAGADDLILVTGSLYVAAEALEAMRRTIDEGRGTKVVRHPNEAVVHHPS